MKISKQANTTKLLYLWGQFRYLWGSATFYLTITQYVMMLAVFWSTTFYSWFLKDLPFIVPFWVGLVVAGIVLIAAMLVDHKYTIKGSMKYGVNQFYQHGPFKEEFDKLHKEYADIKEEIKKLHEKIDQKAD